MNRIWTACIALLAALALGSSPVLPQDEPPAPEVRLDASEIEPFLGEWVLEVMTDQGTLNSLLTFRDDDNGKATADFYLSQITDSTVENILRTETGVLLKWNIELGDQLVPVEVEIAREGDELRGDLRTAFFEAVIKGQTKEAAEAAGIIVERQDLREPEELSSARIEIAGQGVRVRCDRLPAPGPDYDLLDTLADGEVLGPVYGKPLKFWTDADLRFGDQVIAAHNHGPTYPGVYSLWIKRTGDGWSLVFNHLADVWGTMHLPEHDAAEAALTFSTLSEPAPEAEVELEAADVGGVLTIRWGSMEWTASFDVAE